QEAVLDRFVALTAFIPLLISAGGNVGAQSSTVVIRGLNTDEVSLGKATEIIRREAIAGTLLGVMLGFAAMLVAYVLQGNLPVAAIVGVSLVGISIMASIAGSALPMLFQKVGFDPALMSAPFITTAVDVLGVTIYLGIARLVLL
ncbi:MAG: magnesium transporter, partial [Elainellaceae cyanobacterium]